MELLRLLRPTEVHARIRLGLDDPASTGAAAGLVCALTSLATRPHWDVRFEPDFIGPTLHGSAELRWLVRPGAFLWPVGRFVGSPVAWRAARAALRAA